MLPIPNYKRPKSRLTGKDRRAPMTDHYSRPEPRGSMRALRLLALTAVGAGVIVLLAAAFVLSYPGIHAMALHAGVSRRLARGYPVIFDAVLVIACAAVLSLRGGGLVSRCYAWLSLLAVLAAAAGADALHSTGTVLPHRPAAATAAVLPWAAALIGFGLLLAMLRQARRVATRQPQDSGVRQDSAARIVPAHEVPAQAPYPAQELYPALEAAPAATAPAAPPATGPPATGPVVPGPVASGGDDAGQDDSGYADVDPLVDQPEEDAGTPAPAFHRMWSSPVPPEDEDQP